MGRVRVGSIAMFCPMEERTPNERMTLNKVESMATEVTAGATANRSEPNNTAL